MLKRLLRPWYSVVRLALGCPRKLVKGQSVGYNPNIPHFVSGLS